LTLGAALVLIACGAPHQPPRHERLSDAAASFELAPARYDKPRPPIALVSGDGTALTLTSIGAASVVEGPLAFTERAPAVRGGASQVSGRLAPELIQRVVRANFAAMRRCYQEGLARQPSLQGRISVRFVIERDGKVANVATSGDLADDEVKRCVGRPHGRRPPLRGDDRPGLRRARPRRELLRPLTL
jgi:hypothetical protein